MHEADFRSVDHTPTLQLLAAKTTGILPMIAEATIVKECVVPKGTDLSLLAKLNLAHKYTVDGLLAKNRDPLPQDATVLLSSSSVPWVAALFSAPQAATSQPAGRSRVRAGLFPAFEAQLRDLTSVLASTETRFTIAAGFPDRMTIDIVLRRYSSVVPAGTLTAAQRSAADGPATAQLLQGMGVEASQYQVGLTKVFMRAGVSSSLERQRFYALVLAAKRIGSQQRGRIARLAYALLLVAAREKKAAAEAHAAEQVRLAQASVAETQRADGLSGRGVAPRLPLIDLSPVVARAHEQLASARSKHLAVLAENARAGESEALRKARALLEPSSENSSRAHRIARWRSRAAAAAALGEGARESQLAFQFQSKRRPPTAPSPRSYGGNTDGELSAAVHSRAVPYEDAALALSLAAQFGYTRPVH
ncbi:P-loop containing nucleoside triphosphate hydrolase protein [Pavlovales sp. CCMP2436]|nr:P-loop containing nucleoside triphosphate hydrolase protein [Pavlovales sp. CCMP2436]